MKNSTFKISQILVKSYVSLLDTKSEVIYSFWEISFLKLILIEGCPKMDRYKIAVQVLVGENKGQGLRVTSKCLWDPTVDNSASYTFTNVSILWDNIQKLFLGENVCMCFGLWRILWIKQYLKEMKMREAFLDRFY